MCFFIMLAEMLAIIVALSLTFPCENVSTFLTSHCKYEYCGSKFGPPNIFFEHG